MNLYCEALTVTVSSFAKEEGLEFSRISLHVVRIEPLNDIFTFGCKYPLGFKRARVTASNGIIVCIVADTRFLDKIKNVIWIKTLKSSGPRIYP